MHGDDLSGAVGSSFTITVPKETSEGVTSKTYVVSGISANDVALYYREILKLRRKSHIAKVTENKELLVESEGVDGYQSLLREQIESASEILRVTPGQLKAFSSSEYGGWFIIWMLIDKRYPGEVTMEDLLNASRKDLFDEAEISEVSESLVTFFDGMRGNWTGQNQEGEGQD